MPKYRPHGNARSHVSTLALLAIVLRTLQGPALSCVTSHSVFAASAMAAFQMTDILCRLDPEDEGRYQSKEKTPNRNGGRRMNRP